jgi:hypothetical protein
VSANPYLTEARQAKAAKIAAALEAAGATLDTVRHADADARRLAADYAGAHLPSDETWALVVKHFEGLERARAAVESALPADPFEGLQ